MTPPNLFTIQHSGSHFIMQLLSPWWNTHHVNGGQGCNFDRNGHVLMGHLNEWPLAKLAELSREHLTIVPMRHPCRIRESWRRRGRTLAELDRSWDILINHVHNPQCVYIPVDTGTREKMLKVASDRMGLDMKTNWDVVCGDYGTSDMFVTPEMLLNEPPEILDFHRMVTQ